MLSSGHCCGYLFRVCLESVAFQTALPFLSLIFVRGASALRPDSWGEGFSSSTLADTRLRLTVAASFLPDIYAGTLVCLSLLLAFIDVTLLVYRFFEFRFLVYMLSWAFYISCYFTIIYFICNMCSLGNLSCMVTVVRSLGLVAAGER